MTAPKKRGRKPGRTTKAQSITLPITLWQAIDRERGKVNRSRYIREIVQGERKPIFER